jgi:hypothetical protein
LIGWFYNQVVTNLQTGFKTEWIRHIKPVGIPQRYLGIRHLGKSCTPNLFQLLANSKQMYPKAETKPIKAEENRTYG